MITKLTEEQKAKFPDYVQEYTGYGFSTHPLDWDKSVEAVKLSYKCANLPEPLAFIRARSPKEGAKMAAVVEKVTDTYSGHELIELATALETWVSTCGSAEPMHPEFSSHKASDSWVSEWEPAIESVTNEDIRRSVFSAVYGQHEAGWVAFYRFFRDELNIEACKQLDGITETVKTCGWWWPFEKVAIIGERPVKIMLDDQSRIHCPDGPAIEYSDGFAVYSWHGRTVNRSVIMDPVTISRIESEQNIEIRRILIERYGQGNYLMDSNCDLIHEDKFGKLYKKDQPGDDPIYMVEVVCQSTGRHFFLGVNPDNYNGKAGLIAHAAVASTWVRESGDLAFKNYRDYEPEIET